MDEMTIMNVKMAFQVLREDLDFLDEVTRGDRISTATLQSLLLSDCGIEAATTWIVTGDRQTTERAYFISAIMSLRHPTLLMNYLNISRNEEPLYPLGELNEMKLRLGSFMEIADQIALQTLYSIGAMIMDINGEKDMARFYASQIENDSRREEMMMVIGL